jgi:hypothetical protein
MTPPKENKLNQILDAFNKTNEDIQKINERIDKIVDDFK